MGPTTHVTQRALAMLRGEGYQAFPVATRACANYNEDDLHNLVGVEALLGDSKSLPDCPKCAVLWDQAVEAGRETGKGWFNKHEET